MLAFVFAACVDRQTGTNALQARHQAEIDYRGAGKLFADKIDNAGIIKQSSDTGNGLAFCTYKVGFQDSTLKDKKIMQMWEKYFDYDMQYSWSALVNGDTIPVTFFQPAIRKSQQLFEAALVFEVPRGLEPDTLVYKDTFGISKKIELIVLNRK